MNDEDFKASVTNIMENSLKIHRSLSKRIKVLHKRIDELENRICIIEGVLGK